MPVYFQTTNEWSKSFSWSYSRLQFRFEDTILKYILFLTFQVNCNCCGTFLNKEVLFLLESSAGEVPEGVQCPTNLLSRSNQEELLKLMLE